MIITNHRLKVAIELVINEIFEWSLFSDHFACTWGKGALKKSSKCHNTLSFLR